MTVAYMCSDTGHQLLIHHSAGLNFPQLRGVFLPPLGGMDGAGETAGFAVAAIARALTATLDLPRWAEFALLVGAGSIEGALLGTGQAS